MKPLVFTVVISLITAVHGWDYNLDSIWECQVDTNNYKVEDWETVHVFMGRSNTEEKSPRSLCSIKLHADTGLPYSDITLKIEVMTANFDNNGVKVTIVDGSYMYRYTDIMSVLMLDSISDTSVFYTSQPYVYILLDRSACSDDTACRNGYDVDLKITYKGVSAYLSIGAVFGITCGGFIFLGLLIGVPVCLCHARGSASSNGSIRQGTKVASYGTAVAVQQPFSGSPISPSQQNSVQSSYCTSYQQQPQHIHQANVPPPYSEVNKYPHERDGLGVDANKGQSDV